MALAPLEFDVCERDANVAAQHVRARRQVLELRVEVRQTLARGHHQAEVEVAQVDRHAVRAVGGGAVAAVGANELAAGNELLTMMKQS